MDSRSSADTAPSDTGHATWSRLDRWLRARLLAQMSGLQRGGVLLQDALGLQHCGTHDVPALVLRVHHPAFYRAVAAYGSVGAGEAFIDGHWSCDDLVGLVRLLVRNRDLLDGMEGGLAAFGSALLRAWHALRPNTRAGARRNIAAHYDLGNDFFRLFLSPDLMYSSALFAGDDDTLEAASTRKLDRIAAKLRLAPDDHVVEIGTG
jgi:cyclopropane-fatty-acyl-phospholipid synthase